MHEGGTREGGGRDSEGSSFTAGAREASARVCEQAGWVRERGRVMLDATNRQALGVDYFHNLGFSLSQQATNKETGTRQSRANSCQE